jgi:hypothetical protein
LFNKRVDDDLYGVKHCSLHSSKCPAIHYAPRCVERSHCDHAPVAIGGGALDAVMGPLHREG